MVQIHSISKDNFATLVMLKKKKKSVYFILTKLVNLLFLQKIKK